MADSYSLIVDRLTSHLGVANEAVVPGATFTDLHVDSLTLVELAVTLEDELSIRLPYIEPGTTLAEAAAQLDDTLLPRDERREVAR